MCHPSNPQHGSKMTHIHFLCYFSQYLKEMFLYHLFFQIVFKYVVFDFHKSLCLFALSLPYKKTVFVFLHGFYTRGSNITHIETYAIYMQVWTYLLQKTIHLPHISQLKHGCFCIIDAFSLIFMIYYHRKYLIYCER